MGNTKHTQGKWKAVNTVGDNYNIEVDNEIIANVSGEGNAKLISAAPDLLKELKSMVNIFYRNLPQDSIGAIRCQKALEAIKKATE